MKFKYLIILLLFSSNLISQPSDYYNPITTAVPFMDMATNARIGGFGEIGVVSSDFYPDAGIFQNPALLSNNARYAGGNTSYSRFAPEFLDEPYLAEINGYYAINKANSVAYNFKVFNLGEITFTDETGAPLETTRLIEYFHQFTYNHSFKNGITLGGGIKYIRSEFGIDYVSGIEVNPANAVAFDLGFNYRKAFELAEFFILNLNTAVNINNFGSKVKYSSEHEGEFLPTDLRLGVLLTPEFKLPADITIGLDLAYQAEKLLVPTPPIYTEGPDGKQVIEKGMDPNISPFRALYQSFYDAPYGFDEEINEIIHKFAGELRIDYKRIAYLAGRIGKFIEDESKGDRNYMTWGIGAGAFGFYLDYKTLRSANILNNDTWALSFGFRTTISNPAFRF